MALFGGTRELTEKERVLQNLQQAESDIQQKIFQLGQMCYEDFKNREIIPDGYGDIVGLIMKLEENRKGFYRNKLRLEGLMMCENCGTAIAYGSMYCNACGKRADIKEEKANMESKGKICGKCGAELASDVMFCGVCGTKVGA